MTATEREIRAFERKMTIVFGIAMLGGLGQLGAGLWIYFLTR